VTIEGASLAGYNGVHTVATVVDADTFTITNAANPGALGASGTCRLTNPSGYFDTLGLATIASMQSGGTVARITSAITGQAVEPMNIGGDPGVKVRFYRAGSNAHFGLVGVNTGVTYTSFFTEANAKAVIDVTAGSADPNTSNATFGIDLATYTNATAANDWTASYLLTKNAGAGTDIVRCKQMNFRSFSPGGSFAQITFNTPFNKLTTQRLRITCSKQLKRTLDLTGLP
jgi:hypothetical protein